MSRHSIHGLKGQLALVTGASSGIGRATAEALAERGVDVVLTGRRNSRLEECSSELTAKYGIVAQSLCFDISDRTATEEALHSIDLARLSILINNAGLALGTTPFQDADVDDWERMIDTNVKGLLYVTRRCLPHMLASGRGHVVNLGSVAGRWVYSGGAVYCATKFAVRALSEGLRFDLLGSPIRVTNIEPGMVETEFSEVRFQGDSGRAKKVYDGMRPLVARDIAETVAWCLERPAHVNIQELVIYPTDQASVGPFVHRRQE
jgi:3-hydroxy acid dehydrogenase/malonic semialdehyde reductase